MLTSSDFDVIAFHIRWGSLGTESNYLFVVKEHWRMLNDHPQFLEGKRHMFHTLLTFLFLFELLDPFASILVLGLQTMIHGTLSQIPALPIGALLATCFLPLLALSL